MSIKLTDKRGVLTQIDHPQEDNIIYLYYDIPTDVSTNLILSGQDNSLLYASYDNGITYEACALPIQVAGSSYPNPIIKIELIDNNAYLGFDSSTKGYLTKIESKSASKLIRLETMECPNLHTISLGKNSISNMNYMFTGCTKLVNIPMLDTSNAISMQYMFQGCDSLLTIPQINTSNVTNMGAMFVGCAHLTHIPRLDTSKVMNMSGMFAHCISLEVKPITNDMIPVGCNIEGMYTGTAFETEIK